MVLSFFYHSHLCFCSFIFTTVWVFFPFIVAYPQWLWFVLHTGVMSSGYAYPLFLLAFVHGEPESSSTHPVKEPIASPEIQRKSCIMSKRPWLFLILSTSVCQSVFPPPALRTFHLWATLPPQQYRPWNSEKATSSVTLTMLLQSTCNCGTEQKSF